MNKKRMAQIILPLAIVAVIASIWFIKNNKNEPNASILETPLEISSVDLAEIHSHGLPSIIDFGSDSCAPCRQMYPALEKMNAEMQGKAIIHFVDVWKYTEAANGFPIQVIPTQAFYTSDGKAYVPGENIQSSIEFTMYSDKNTNEHKITIHEGGLTEEQMRLILSDMGVE